MARRKKRLTPPAPALTLPMPEADLNPAPVPQEAKKTVAKTTRAVSQTVADHPALPPVVVPPRLALVGAKPAGKKPAKPRRKPAGRPAANDPIAAEIRELLPRPGSGQYWAVESEAGSAQAWRIRLRGPKGKSRRYFSIRHETWQSMKETYGHEHAKRILAGKCLARERHSAAA